MSAETQARSTTGGNKKLKELLYAVPMRTALVAIALLWTIPTVGVFVSSFRPAKDIQTSGWWTVFFPPYGDATWTLENYTAVLTTNGMGTAFINSLLVTIPSTVIPISIAAFAAYAFAWMEFRGRDVLFAVVVGLMVVPLHMALIPMLRLYTQFNLNGTFVGTWLFHTGFGLPLAVFLLYGYISTLPREMMESAYIDGASPFQTFVRLVVPLSVPALAAFAIFQFLWVWNDLLVALIFLGTSNEVAVVTTRLSNLVGERGEDWHVLTAGAFFTMIMPLIIFFALQRFFVRGLTAGSVKG